MNKAETGESSLDDTVAVPAKEVAWWLPAPTSCTTSIEMSPSSSAHQPPSDLGETVRSSHC